MIKITSVDEYLLTGCMRCKFGGTPRCKVHDWKEELIRLRAIMQAAGLTEEVKWGMPCYTSGGKNIAMVSALHDHASIGFFKGALLSDPKGLLVSPGEHSQAVRTLRFTSVKEITQQTATIKAFIKQALELEKAGKKIAFKKTGEHPVPEEFRKALEESAALKKAFEALTPGRQRAYLLHFSGSKQSETRTARIKKCIPQILKGIGFHDAWKQQDKK
ncbi:MAG: YdeI/OmpD-associated family protein [Bacteroidota bacterium]